MYFCKIIFSIKLDLFEATYFIIIGVAIVSHFHPGRVFAGKAGAYQNGAVYETQL